MSTLIIGKRCQDGIILAADRRELRGYEPREQPKIQQVEIQVDMVKVLVLLAGAGVAAFWDEVAWSISHSISTGAAPPVKTLLDVVDRVSSLSINMFTRYQRGGFDEPLGCVVAGLENLTSDKAKMYYFAGAGFSATRFICLGSGDAYALPLADVLLNTRPITLEQATKILPLLFVLVERVNVSVGGGPDIFILRDGEQAVQVATTQVQEARAKVLHILENLPEVVNKL